jgi:hypothetical protein
MEATMNASGTTAEDIYRDALERIITTCETCSGRGLISADSMIEIARKALTDAADAIPPQQTINR